jgi:prepilin-type N-terminal cleavage/methylation domain-containing protein
MIFYNKKIGFTLAEVLITLLIIGVVASLVIPSIIQDAQDAEFKTLYKKAFAVASQATNTARSESLFTPRSVLFEEAPSLYNFNVFKNQFSVSKECMNNNNSQCWYPNGEKICDETCGGSGGPYIDSYAFIDASGMVWSLYQTFEDIIIVDTNGNKQPNKYGRDRWVFVFKDQQNNRITDGLPYKIAPFASEDIDYVSDFFCHYPPCYYIKWLKE